MSEWLVGCWQSLLGSEPRCGGRDGEVLEGVPAFGDGGQVLLVVADFLLPLAEQLGGGVEGEVAFGDLDGEVGGVAAEVVVLGLDGFGLGLALACDVGSGIESELAVADLLCEIAGVLEDGVGEGEAGAADVVELGVGAQGVSRK
ncbi:hypothetical protein LN042_33585 [Kitasatospora sp. RB6PN24]|uniref:hypothetical protein n=1 Tax=Kitasatospora humi TaxID=2893891 RepID=UPI001E63A50A|nr:hypothetical protein [Kitasatospora humi]MCC9311939.1 hypothetical protein [Kitasatospora humi]